MAKQIKKFLAITMVFLLCVSFMSVSASAREDWKPGNGSSKYEWYTISVQGQVVASAQGPTGQNRWLGMTYTAGATVSDTTLNWYIRTNGGTHGNYGGSVDLTQYITIPEGFSVKDFDIEVLNIEGVNSQQDQYDNCVMNITILTLLDEEGNEVVIPPADPIDYEPQVQITKSADKASYKVGETITWTITVRNISEYTAYNVAVSDLMTGDAWTIAELAPGAEQSFTATSLAEETGSLRNVATVSWDDNDEIDDSLEEEVTSGSDEEIVDVTEPEPEPTEPEPTEPEPTEPEPTEPEPTEPEPTEPEPTEPEPTEPEPTEPEPTEPEVIDPTDPVPENEEGDETDPTDPVPQDDDVPLADVPKTGDLSLIWVAASLLSAGGLLKLHKKREED